MRGAVLQGCLYSSIEHRPAASPGVLLEGVSLSTGTESKPISWSSSNPRAPISSAGMITTYSVRVARPALTPLLRPPYTGRKKGAAMSEMIELSEEHYQSLARAAMARGQTPQTLLAQMIDALPAPSTRCVYETEDWFRHLGATEEQITESARLAREERDKMARADA